MRIIEHTAHFEIDQHADDLFPLFSAEGEKKWVPGWEYENVMGTTELEEDYVFTTENHDHGKGRAVWLVKRYNPDERSVEFYKVEPDEKVGVISLCCTPSGKNSTKISVTYKYIALSEKGESFIKDFTAEKYEGFISEWHRLLVAYFEWEEQDHAEEEAEVVNKNKAV